MSRYEPRVDAYIAAAAGFARPILGHLREVVHVQCPAIEETIKWGAPSFMLDGKILCGMAAFRQHVSFGFWKHAAVMGNDAQRDGMGSFGRMRSLADVPPRDALVAMLQKAVELNGQAIPRQGVRRSVAPKPAPVAPDDLRQALQGNPRAMTTFQAFPPGQQREYIDWIVEAKRDETRRKRLLQAIAWLEEGKRRNWKYMSSQR